MKSSLLSLLFASLAKGDIYMQMPRGSNNRLDEQNRERDNANRLMDTQNNNRGGYNVGKMEYYNTEIVPITWTNQHGSSKYQMENSEFVLQYMCSPLLRDGTTTRTIPLKATECQNYDCDTDVRFGRHESLDSYQMCKTTERNKGLFNANQNLKRNDATSTRQNPNGNRSGLECPEERDNYPYWRPSEWVDLAYITSDTEKCDNVLAESQNVKPRFECRMPDAFFAAGGTLPNNFVYPLDQAECLQVQLSAPANDAGVEVTYTAEYNVVPAHGVPPPACLQIETTRANHHGNPGGRTHYEYNWQVPESIPPNSQCAVRLRYNITTAEFQAWESAASLNAGVDATANSLKNKPNPNNDPAELPMWEEYGLTRANVERSFSNNVADQANTNRQYVLENNPQVDAFGKEFGNGVVRMQLAVNTAQFGRGFEDRSHMFMVNPTPDEVPEGATVKLLTVRGKRGNIVQVYPATEYFFHPEKMYMTEGDYLHIEHTGSNTNPNNNDGQGRQGTDRSNYIVQQTIDYSTALYSNFEREMTFEDGQIDTGSSGTSYPSYVKQPDGYIIPAELQKDVQDASMGTLGGMSELQLSQLATGMANLAYMGNMEELDDAGTSFNLAPTKMTDKGCWNYMGTRNNNFSNRAQKGTLCVTKAATQDVYISTARTEINPDMVASQITIWPNSVEGPQNAHITVETKGTSDVVAISGMQLSDDGTMTVQVGFSPTALTESQLVWQEPCSDNHVQNADCDNPWKSIPFKAHTNDRGEYVATADVGQVGTFKVVSKPSAAPIFALFVAVCGFVLALSYVLYKRCGDKLPGRFKRQPKAAAGSVQATDGTQMAWTTTNTKGASAI